jgi:hypothetical protein
MSRVSWRRDADGSVLKTCTRCNVEKPLDQYGKHSRCKFGKNPWCKQCVSDYQEDNAVEIKRRRLERYKEISSSTIFKESNRRKAKGHYWANRSKRLEYAKQYRSTPEFKEKFAEYYKGYRGRNYGKLEAYQKRYGRKNRKRLNAYELEKKRSDPVFRLRRLVSSTVSTALKKRGSSKNGSRTFNLVGYSPSDLKRHLESLFTGAMSWDNYGYYWSIDHIIPQVMFPYRSLEDPLFKECWKLSNLRPLPKTDNFKKGRRLPCQT